MGDDGGAVAVPMPRPPMHQRSFSLPRIHSSPGDAYSVASGALPATSPPSLDAVFDQGARSLLECRAAVRQLTQEANAARAYREKCAQVMGAALGASLALQEALLSPGYEEQLPQLRPIRVELQLQVTAAESLVRKYGRQSPVERWLAWETRESVDARFDATIEALHRLADQTWDLIPSENRVKRLAADPTSAAALKSGCAFTRSRLRSASQHKVQAMMYYRYSDQCGPGHDGCVAYAAHRTVKVHDLSGQVSTAMDCNPEAPLCLAHGACGLLWGGQADGSVRVWSTETAGAAAAPLRVTCRSVCAISVDDATGLCWAGTEDGEVLVIRHRPTDVHFGRLEVERVLVGYDAHSPTSADAAARRSFDATSSSASSSAGRSTLLGSAPASSGGGPHAAFSSSAGATGSGAIDILSDCLPMAPGSVRVSGSAVHVGAVVAIVAAPAAGRVYSAGGASKATSQVLVWEARRGTLLRTISRRSTPLLRSPVTAMALVTWASVAGSSAAGRGASSRGCECHLLTGHANGELLLWDTTGDSLKPVLHLGRQRGAVRAIVVCGELGLLCSGHATGKVALRKLDPNWRIPPRDGTGISRTRAAPAVINAHRLGLLQLVGGGHVLVTTGGSGSIKVWPETALRCAADAAGIRLPHSSNSGVATITDILGQGLQGARTSSTHLTSTDGSLPGARALSGRIPSDPPPAGAATPPPPAGDVQLAAVTSPARGANGHPLSAGGAAGRPAAAAAASSWRARRGEGEQTGTSGEESESSADAPGPLAAGREPSRAVHRRLSSFVRATRGSSNGRLPDGFEQAPWNIPYADLRIVRKIGQGSFGRVYLATWKETEVAVKEFNIGGESSWEMEPMRQEVEILAELRHPNVVELLGVCLDHPAVVTNYYHNRSLYDVLSKARYSPEVARRLTWRQRLQMALGAARGMNYLHTNVTPIVHRDLKSPNLFVDQYYTVKVGDFNLSRYLDANSTIVSGPENNPRWSAPEVFEGRFSKEADVFSFGVVLWELMTWQEPWASEPPAPTMNSFQIMMAIKEGQRPLSPAVEALPGGACPAAPLRDYIALLEDCWAQDPTLRPTFHQVIQRLNGIARQVPPGRSGGAAAPAPAPVRGRSEPQLAAAAAPAAAGRHPRSASEVPVMADLISLDDDVPAAAAAAPPPAAAPVAAAAPASATADDLLMGTSPPPAAAAAAPRARLVSPFVNVSPFAGASGAAAAGPLPPPPPPKRPPASPFAAAAAATGNGASPAAAGAAPSALPTSFSGYVAAGSAMPAAAKPAPSPAASPFAAASAQVAQPPPRCPAPAASALPTVGLQQPAAAAQAQAAAPLVGSISAATASPFAAASSSPSLSGGAGFQAHPHTVLSASNPFARGLAIPPPPPAASAAARGPFAQR